MRRTVVSFLALAVLAAACSHNTNGGSTIEPGPASASRGEGGPQQGRGRGGPGGQQMLLRGITLSADQQQRIDGIRAKYRTQMEQMRQQGGQGDRSAMRQLMENQQTEIRAVLTPDQQKQFDQNVAEMRSRMQGGRGRGGQPPR